MQKLTASNHQSNKRERKVKIDLFSQLPDHIIVSILSRLPLNDALKTSVLSRRWKHMWKHTVDTNLVFSGKLMPRLSNDKFVSWVDKFLESYKEKNVHEFAIWYPLNLNYSDSIDSWVAFALKKDLRRLQLDFSGAWSGLERRYVLPDLNKLSVACSVRSNLRDIRLCDLEIDQNMLENFLSNCSNLERLCLQRVESIARLKGDCQNLKWLEVSRCFNEKIMISAPNLISITYNGHEVFPWENYPLISEIYFAGCSKFYVKQLTRNFSLATRLTTVKLGLTEKMVKASISYPHNLVEFTVLKNLEIVMYAWRSYCLLWPISLIKKAPQLHKFVAKVRSEFNKCGGKQNEENHYCSGRNVRNADTTKHKCLKVVEFYGYVGLKNQMELVEQVCEIAESLEKISLEVDIGVFMCWRHILDGITERAKLFLRELPAGIKGVVRHSSKMKEKYERYSWRRT